MGLSQEQAQSLIDFHTAQVRAAAEATDAVISDMRNDWRAKIGADPELGRVVNGVPALSPKVNETLGRLYDTMDPKDVSAFKEALDLTGAGDNPAFLRFFYKLAQRQTEGRPTNANGPSPLGQVNPSAAPKSMASAMFPNLPSSQS